MTLLGRTYLAKFDAPLAAYNRLQTDLMRRFFCQGGTVEAWVQRLAPAFRRRHGWICEELVPVRAEARQRDRWPYY